MVAFHLTHIRPTRLDATKKTRCPAALTQAHTHKRQVHSLVAEQRIWSILLIAACKQSYINCKANNCFVNTITQVHTTAVQRNSVWLADLPQARPGWKIGLLKHAPHAPPRANTRSAKPSTTQANRTADKSVLQFLPFSKHNTIHYATKNTAPMITPTVSLPDDDHQHSCCEAVWISTP